SADRAFPAFALSVAIITVANGSREGLSAPGASPVPPGAPCLRGTGARAPHPTPPSDASGGALDERGYGNIYLGNVVSSNASRRFIHQREPISTSANRRA